MTTKNRRVLWFTIRMVVAWALAAFVAGEFLQPGTGELAEMRPLDLAPPDSLATRLTRSVVAGVNAGLIASFLELKVLPRHALRLSAGAMLLARTLVYAAVGVFSVFATARFIAIRELGISMRELVSSEGFRDFLAGPQFVSLILTFVLASFLINAALQVARLLGPRTVTQILLGRYLRPVEEDRAFLFVDLADSTGIAERLGPLRFAEFKNEFFHDLAEPVLDARGQIVQYVGDEVMITWPIEESGACVECFFSIRERVSARADEYRRRFDCVPLFRGGLHSGRVVVSQLGDIKQEIAFSGDAVNTASRIQGLCRPLGHDFLASSATLSSIAVPANLIRSPLGVHRLRGRESAIELVALRVEART